jgi:hypothetical protein
MSHYLVEQFDSINYHLFRQHNFPIRLSGIFLITDDVIDVVIQLSVDIVVWIFYL